MIELHLLINKTGIHYLLKNKHKIQKEEKLHIPEDSQNLGLISLIQNLLSTENFSKIHAYWAKPVFGLCPSNQKNHDLAKHFIALNSKFEEEHQELMLNINLKHKLQFYFGFDKDIYEIIKDKDPQTQFYFSGEKFLQELKFVKGKKSQVHINLYDNQVEFWVFKNQEVLLYNLLDENAEVDFLYFILFSLSKLPIEVQNTEIYLYGECQKNETFVSELKKYTQKCSIISQNQLLKNHILLHNV